MTPKSSSGAALAAPRSNTLATTLASLGRPRKQLGWRIAKGPRGKPDWDHRCPQCRAHSASENRPVDVVGEDSPPRREAPGGRVEEAAAALASPTESEGREALPRCAKCGLPAGRLVR
jgi:hypothetical protein